MPPGVFLPHEKHPNREIHPHSYEIPTADYDIRTNPHLYAQTRALTCKQPIQQREMLI